MTAQMVEGGTASVDHVHKVFVVSVSRDSESGPALKLQATEFLLRPHLNFVIFFLRGRNQKHCC